MKKIPRPCLDCGVLTTNQSRCDTHQVARELRQTEANLAKKRKKALLYNSRYTRQARAIRETTQICYLCNQVATPTDPIEADHLFPSLLDQSPLLGAHRNCNNRKGGRDVDQLTADEFPALFDHRGRNRYGDPRAVN